MTPWKQLEGPASLLLDRVTSLMSHFLGYELEGPGKEHDGATLPESGSATAEWSG